MPVGWNHWEIPSERKHHRGIMVHEGRHIEPLLSFFNLLFRNLLFGIRNSLIYLTTLSWCPFGCLQDNRVTIADLLGRILKRCLISTSIGLVFRFICPFLIFVLSLEHFVETIRLLDERFQVIKIISYLAIIFFQVVKKLVLKI